ncbi:hypothetical protein ONE63_007291 [Megalurothrips usitatus]|uniref:Uncharacterized protein n=1 Tax=Megalurothrips usitatus TaxID=439358 RepID=A0AAV7XZ48_9NEOP|nr:hypothetical protein ONE63_007291 [Megalurothrips usitatus]
MTIVSHYAVHTLILNVMVVTAGLLDQVARQMEEGIPSQWLSAHRRVIQASREVERSFGADAVYMFAAVLGAPLIGSVDVRNEVHRLLLHCSSEAQ